MPTTTITLERIKETMLERWSEAAEEYGDAFSVPKEERFNISETERALHVLHVWNAEGAKGNPGRFLRMYGVPESIVVDVLARWCDMRITEEELTEIRTEKRSDKYDALIAWTRDKVGEQYTTEAVVEVAGFSYPTVLKFLQDSPHFRKVKKGLWEIRDPKADREAGV